MAKHKKHPGGRPRGSRTISDSVQQLIVASYLARPARQTRTQYLNAMAAKAERGDLTYRNAIAGELGPVRRWMSREAYKKALQRAEVRYRDEPTFKAATDDTAHLMRVLILSAAAEGKPQPAQESTPQKRKKKASAPRRGK